MKQERTRRASGMGNIRRYGNGWRAELRWSDALGKRRFRTRVTKTRQEAEAALAEFRRERDAGLASVRPSTLGELLEAWREAKVPEVAHSTAQQYRWAIDKLAHAHDARLSEITPRLLDTVLGTVQGSARSRQIVRTVLRAATAWGVAQGLLQSDPGKGTRAIRQPSREVKAWSPVEIQALLEACKTDRLGSLFLLVAFLGLRRGEALALRWSDYDSEARTLSITSRPSSTSFATLERARQLRHSHCAAAVPAL